MIIGQCWICNSYVVADSIDDNGDDPPAWRLYNGQDTDGAISAICQACMDGDGPAIEIATLPDVI